jgi:hypothetical protein
MAQKHEIMAKLQAARQNSPKIVETETQKAYPDTQKSGQLEISQFLEEIEEPKPVPSPAEAATPEEQAPTAEITQYAETNPETSFEQTRASEKVSYTTISVPKQYGQKAKLCATLLRLNMVEFTCGALDAYILQLKETGKLPKLDL